MTATVLTRDYKGFPLKGPAASEEANAHDPGYGTHMGSKLLSQNPALTCHPFCWCACGIGIHAAVHSRLNKISIAFRERIAGLTSSSGGFTCELLAASLL